MLLVLVGCGDTIRPSADLSEPPVDLPFHTVWLNQTPDLVGVKFFDRKTGYAIGTQGQFLKTQDGGSEWERTWIGDEKCLEQRGVTEAQFIDPMTGWIVCTMGVNGKTTSSILRTRDGGKSWDSSNLDYMIRAIHFVDRQNGWAVGDEVTFDPSTFSLQKEKVNEGMIFATTTGGEEWSVQKTVSVAVHENFSGFPALIDIFFINRSTGWAVGADGSAWTTNDGAHWDQREIGTSADLNQVFFLNEQVGWILSKSHTYATREGFRISNRMYSTRDGGKSWSSFAAPPIQQFEFINEQSGWAVGTRSLLSTADGGQTWKHRFERVFLDKLSFFDDQTGWAIGRAGSVYATSDGGEKWNKKNASPDWPIRSLRFLNDSHGYGLDENGSLRWTKDGGNNWHPKGESRRLDAAYFLNSSTGWALQEGWVLFTNNGGQTWQKQNPEASPSLRAIWFVDEEVGWAVGEKGEILMTSNQGKSWTPQKSGTTANLSSVIFIDTNMGWVVGDERTALSTHDGGKTWKSLLERNEGVSFKSVAFANATTGWVVGSWDGSDRVVFETTNAGQTWDRILNYGDYSTRSYENAVTCRPSGTCQIVSRIQSRLYRSGTLLESQPTDWGPYVSNFLSSEGSLKTLLRWRVKDEQPSTVTATVEYSSSPKDDPDPIDLEAPLKASHDGWFELGWNPRDYEIADGAELSYTIVLTDESGLTYRHRIPGTFAYNSIWNHEAVRGSLIAAGLLGGYGALCLALLWLAPLGLLRIHQHLPFRDLLAQTPGPGIALLATALLNATGLPALAKHPRTRRAWAERYRAGQVEISDLPPELRAAYLTDPAFLDAWVELRASKARQALQLRDSVKSRRVYIELPVGVGAPEEGRRLPEPMPPALRELLAPERVVLAILGEGGIGKSTLAFQIASWAVADEPERRLAPHRMIPVLIEEETKDLTASVTGQLREILGAGDEVDDDVVASLLRSKRLLVIVDALSERSSATQKHIETIHRSAQVNALVVTSRRLPAFDSVPVVHLWPEKLDTNVLVTFVIEYLRRSGHQKLFPKRAPLELGDRFLAVIERGGERFEVTPLLVKLFVEQAIELRKRGEPLERLPTSIAEIMVGLVRGTNPETPETPNYVAENVLVRAARVLGKVCLENVYVPRDFFRDAAEAALAQESIQSGGADIVSRLVDNGVLRERDRAGTRILRFAFDPVAEYMAALYWVNRWRGDEKQWSAWLEELRAVSGYPQALKGFLVALDDCIRTYRDDFGIPPIDLSWNEPARTPTP